MKKLLIHIGTGKTGTTSIQQSLLAAQRQKTLGPVCYPDFLKSKWRHRNPHRVLAYLYRPHKISRRFKSKGREDDLKALISEFRRELERYFLENDNVILSTEYLGNFSRDEVVQFRKDLEQYAPSDVTVVIYVRNPADLYVSLVNQALRKSSAIREPGKYKYSFRKAISNWGGVFDGNIIVRPFDRALLHQNCVVQDFVGVSSGFFSREIGPVKTSNTNESLSAEAMVLLQKYTTSFPRGAPHGPMPDSRRLSRILEELREALPQTKARLKKEVAHLITERHKEDLIWLRARHGIDFLPKADSPAPAWKPVHGEVQVGEIMETKDEVARELLFYTLHSALKRRHPSTREANVEVTASHDRSGRTDAMAVSDARTLRASVPE